MNDHPKNQGSLADPDAVHRPFCTFAEAAHWLGISGRTLRNRFQGQQTFPPALVMSEPGAAFLSLADLADAFVLGTIRRKDELSLQSTRMALEFLRSHTKLTHPLSAVPLLTGGESLLTC